MDFKKYMLAGMLGRIPRYVLGGYVLVFVLQEFDSEVLNEYTLILSIIGMLLVALYYVGQTIYNVYKKKQQA
jgi:membrane protein DedA with SNARE-associated domain